MTKEKSPRVVAREKRDNAIIALGQQVYAEWRGKGRPKTGPSTETVAALEAVDDACADVALQS